MLYFRFILCLGVGLFGMTMVLMTMMDAVFNEWDVSRDAQRWIASLSKKKQQRSYYAEDMGRVEHLSTRLMPNNVPQPLSSGAGLAANNRAASPAVEVAPPPTLG
ncbi:MAG: hypothetical protein WC728_10205 [Elusimicrobiota bacterium]